MTCSHKVAMCSIDNRVRGSPLFNRLLILYRHWEKCLFEKWHYANCLFICLQNSWLRSRYHWIAVRRTTFGSNTGSTDFVAVRTTLFFFVSFQREKKKTETEKDSKCKPFNYAKRLMRRIKLVDLFNKYVRT